ncbi:amino acid permease [Paenibacillus montaniterrae]|uniref:Amino acid permease n=1 Tax=Paenibacillus montaniterrae TaxID=429341 RepID=A0A919YMJ8_9BACL|nr:APC family permease [Paenibacillus montaniterrae]GIP14866.1 amino acid permease [Paenibacillus montaniterrae]
MIGIMLFMLLVLTAVVCMLLITIKAQKGLRSINYISGLRYGKVVQQLQDKYELHRFGFGQYLRRQYGEVSIFSIAMNAIGILPILLLMLAPIMMNGGLGSSLFVYCGLGLFFIMLFALVGQYLSAQPTAGGLYHVALRKGGTWLGSIIGSLQLIGQTLLLIGYSYGFVFFLKLLLPVSISWLNQPGGMTIAVAICVLTQVILAWLKSTVYRTFHIIAWLLQLCGIVLLIVCAVMVWRGDSYNGMHLFLADASVAGWFPAVSELDPANWGLLLALMCRCFIGGDISAQHAEETIEPKIKVSWATLLSTCYSYMIGLVLILVLAILYMNFGIAGAGQTGEAWLVYLLGQSSVLGYALVAVAMLSCWASSSTLLQSGARTLMALARDGLLPFKQQLAAMHYLKQSPQRALFAVTVLALLMLAAIYYIPTEDIFITSTLLAVICYGSLYAILFFFTPLADQASLWKVAGWEKAIRFGSMLLLTALVSAAGASLPLTALLIIAVPLLVISIYAMMTKGVVSKPLSYDTKGSNDLFEIERRMPLQ